MNLKEFDEYFEALNGVKPFPWQRRLASRLLKGKEWPSIISLQTGTGKTSVLDIAVFCLAAQASKAKRSTGRRIFYIIDRRIIVDAVYDKARSIKQKLLDALKRNDGGILSTVASALMKYGGEQPLDVVRLRGAMYRDEGWAGSPTQPLICVSTVDQVGSRLLFRGYGLSAGARPIHAGLIANDSLLILDEAHISAPFTETVHAVERYRGHAWTERSLGLPFKLVRMSATLDGDFTLSAEDMKNPVLHQRLNAHKPTTLHRVPDASFETSVAEMALNTGHGATLVMLNTVSAARAVFHRLRAKGADAVLLTGCSRPYDRDLLVSQVSPRIDARSEPDNRTLHVVATQCLEVGVDYDFCVLITECASMNGMVQRFGKLDRFGKRNPAKGVIMIRQSQASGPDWLYGKAMMNTWKWLGERKKLDFCPRTINGQLKHVAKQNLTMEQSPAPVLLPAYLDALVQTNPQLEFEPDVAPFLHGNQNADADVLLVWRADLAHDNSDAWISTVSALPPSAREAMPVALSFVKAWLKQTTPETIQLTDLEGAGTRKNEIGYGGAGRLGSGAEEDREGNALKVLRWCGPDDSAVVEPDEIKAGDTIIVPAVYGGADKFGWNPESREAVCDIAEFVSFERGNPTIRLHADITSSWFSDHAAPQVLTTAVETLHQDSMESQIRDVLTLLRDNENINGTIRGIASSLLEGAIKCSRHPSGVGWVVRGRGRSGWDEQDSSFTQSPVTLNDHSEAVRAKVREFADKIHLPAPVIKDLELAAVLHDGGKADPRFQVLLYGGDEVAAIDGELLAKSVMDPRDRDAVVFARQRSGYPRGARHEGLSVSMIQGSAAKENANDFDLALHLVASHHGHSRPFFPVTEDDAVGVSVTLDKFKLFGNTRHDLWRLDSGASDRFWRLTRRYGYYGLAFLEAVIRLADQQCSERGQ